MPGRPHFRWLTTSSEYGRRTASRDASDQAFWRRLRFEPLENRWLLAITVNTLVDESDGSIVDGDISLRDAIALAPADETINFASTLTAGGPTTINLTVGPSNSQKNLTIDKSLTINGPGANLLTIKAFDPDASGTDDGDGSRVFTISDGTSTLRTVTISGLTLTGGDVASSGGAVLNFENLTISACLVRGNS